VSRSKALSAPPIIRSGWKRRPDPIVGAKAGTMRAAATIRTQGLREIAVGCFMPLFTILSIDGGGIARPLIDSAYDGGSDTVDGQMRQLQHIVKRPYLYFRFQPSLSQGVSALDDTSDRNIEDLKRRAELVFDDPDKSEKIENLCKVLKQRTGSTT
jgi:hypothetical protein